jgi:hypothetical protein
MTVNYRYMKVIYGSLTVNYHCVLIGKNGAGLAIIQCALKESPIQCTDTNGYIVSVLLHMSVPESI